MQIAFSWAPRDLVREPFRLFQTVTDPWAFCYYNISTLITVRLTPQSAKSKQIIVRRELLEDKCARGQLPIISRDHIIQLHVTKNIGVQGTEGT